jgi:large subunit ribosomal protein L30
MAEGQIRVTLKRSGIGRPFTQKAVLKGLGLTKLQKTVVLKDTPAARGMVRKVIHLLEVEVL